MILAAALWTRLHRNQMTLKTLHLRRNLVWWCDLAAPRLPRLPPERRRDDLLLFQEPQISRPRRHDHDPGDAGDDLLLFQEPQISRQNRQNQNRQNQNRRDIDATPPDRQ